MPFTEQKIFQVPFSDAFSNPSCRRYIELVNILEWLVFKTQQEGGNHSAICSREDTEKLNCSLGVETLWFQ